MYSYLHKILFLKKWVLQFSLHILLLIFRFHPSHVYMLFAVPIMIIVLEPCYEVMNHYVPSNHCISSCLMYLLCILHIFIRITSKRCKLSLVDGAHMY
jgi:hypothetical protein